MALPQRRPHRTVDRIAEILEIAAREPQGATLTEFATQLDAPVSSVQGLVNGLVAASFLDEDRKRYTLGPRPYVLNLIAGRPPVRSIRHADLELLTDLTGETTLLAIALGNRAVYIDHVASGSSHDVYLASAHVLRPLIRTCSGRVLLAYSDQRDLVAYLKSLKGEEQEFVDGFLAELDEIRSSGIAYSHNYVGTPNCGAAVPIIEDGKAVAALAVVGPQQKIEHRLPELGQVLRTHTLTWARRTLS